MYCIVVPSQIWIIGARNKNLMIATLWSQNNQTKKNHKPRIQNLDYIAQTNDFKLFILKECWLFELFHWIGQRV